MNYIRIPKRCLPSHQIDGLCCKINIEVGRFIPIIFSRLKTTLSEHVVSGNNIALRLSLKLNKLHQNIKYQYMKDELSKFNLISIL